MIGSAILPAAPSIVMLYVLGPEPSASGYSEIVESVSQGTVSSRSSVDNLWFTTIQSMETVTLGRS